MVAHVSNSTNEEMKTGGSLGVTGQPGSQTWQMIANERTGLKKQVRAQVIIAQ